MQLILANEAAGGDIYKLPTELAAKVQEQYDRDVARVRCAVQGSGGGGGGSCFFPRFVLHLLLVGP